MEEWRPLHPVLKDEVDIRCCTWGAWGHRQPFLQNDLKILDLYHVLRVKNRAKIGYFGTNYSSFAELSKNYGPKFQNQCNLWERWPCKLCPCNAKTLTRYLPITYEHDRVQYQPTWCYCTPGLHSYTPNVLTVCNTPRSRINNFCTLYFVLLT